MLETPRSFGAGGNQGGSSGYAGHVIGLTAQHLHTIWQYVGNRIDGRVCTTLGNVHLWDHWRHCHRTRCDYPSCTCWAIFPSCCGLHLPDCGQCRGKLLCEQVHFMVGELVPRTTWRRLPAGLWRTGHLERFSPQADQESICSFSPRQGQWLVEWGVLQEDDRLWAHQSMEEPAKHLGWWGWLSLRGKFWCASGLGNGLDGLLEKSKMVREVSIVWKLEVICWAAGDEASCPLYKKFQPVACFCFQSFQVPG